MKIRIFIDTQVFIALPKIIINKEENSGSRQCDKQSTVCSWYPKCQEKLAGIP